MANAIKRVRPKNGDQSKREKVRAQEWESQTVAFSGGVMRAQSAAKVTRPVRDEGDTLKAADPYCDVSNLLFRPRAGNVGEDTRAGKAAR
jgi:hypothetical protein